MIAELERVDVVVESWATPGLPQLALGASQRFVIVVHPDDVERLPEMRRLGGLSEEPVDVDPARGVEPPSSMVPRGDQLTGLGLEGCSSVSPSGRMPYLAAIVVAGEGVAAG